MKEPKRYYCGNGDGMFQDDKNGHWVEYSEHKSIVETLTEQLRKHAVSGQVCGFYMAGMDTSGRCNNCERPQHEHN